MGPHLHSNGLCPYSFSYEEPIVYDSTVKSYQNKLNIIGYRCGVVDGKIGPITKKAIMNFQIDNRLEVDGNVGPITFKKLGLD